MAKLITGGTGYIGSELAHLLVERGEEVVLFDIVLNESRIEDIKDKVKMVRGDLGIWPDVLNAVMNNEITGIYHLGGVLSYTSEISPWLSFQTNVIGTYNVLEAARLSGVSKVVFSSTIGTFGLNANEALTDTTIQRPTLMYGCGKLYGENLGRFYRNKFELDFRSVRYPTVIGPDIRTQGHWAPPMIEDAIMGRQHECIYATPDSRRPVIYLTDATRAIDMLLNAPKEHIKMVNYNVSGIPDAVSVREVEMALTKRYPDTKISYNLERVKQEEKVRKDIFHTIKRFDDSYARKEWGWKPEYATVEAIIEKFEKDFKEHPKRFGLK
ncbi:NAD-dependent epimerase/dehydratase family protein [Chloroflexota bacterium]